MRAAFVLAFAACGRVGFDGVPTTGDAAGDAVDSSVPIDVPPGFVGLDRAVGAGGFTGVGYPLTVGSGANRALAVFVHVANDCSLVQPSIASVTFAGQPLVGIRRQTNPACAGMYSELWALPPGVQPPTGVNDVIVELTGPLLHDGWLNSGAIAATGVDPATTFSTIGGDANSGPTASTTLAANSANDLVVYSACNGSLLSTTPNTEVWKTNIDTSASCKNTGGAYAPGGTTALTWNGNSDMWSIIGAAFKSNGSTVGFAGSANGFTTGGYDLARLPIAIGTDARRAIAAVTHESNICTAPPPQVTAVSIGSMQMMMVNNIENATCVGTRSRLWTLPPGVEPASGASSLLVKTAGHTNTTQLHYGAVVAFGVDPSTTFSALDVSNGRSTLASLTLPASGPKDLVAFAVCAGNTMMATSQTQQWLRNMSSSFSCDNSGGATAPGGTTSLSWANVDDVWNIIGFAFKAL